MNDKTQIEQNDYRMRTMEKLIKEAKEQLKASLGVIKDHKPNPYNANALDWHRNNIKAQRAKIRMLKRRLSNSE